MAVAKGKILDSATNEGVPYATVTVTDRNTGNTKTVSADAGGNYAIDSPAVTLSSVISATSVGYLSAAGTTNSGYGVYNLYLVRDQKELPEVIVKSNRGVSKGLLIGGGALLLLMAAMKNGKRRLSGIFPGGAITDTLMPVILVGGVVIVLKYGDVILEKFGIKKNKDEKATEDAVSDPNSFWDPSFWKKGPTGSLILKDSAVNDLMKLLDFAFGIFNDNEAAVINAFKTLRTQSQLSYFADKFQQAKGKRLADWLFADSWPYDRLSLAEMAEINKYFEKLPKYKP